MISMFWEHSRPPYEEVKLALHRAEPPDTLMACWVGVGIQLEGRAGLGSHDRSPYNG